MDKALKRVDHSLYIVLTVALIGSACLFLYWLDRQYSVVKSTQLEYIKPETPFTSLIGGTFDKVRDCDYRDVKFYKGERGDRSPSVQRDLLEKNKIRKTGLHEFGDWRVHANSAEFNEIYSDAVHQCFIHTPLKWGKNEKGEQLYFRIPFPWHTVTPFYK